MSYLFLAIVLFSGTAKGYCGKKTSNFANHLYDAAYINAIRFAICALISGVLCVAQGGFSALLNFDGLWVAALSGVLQAAFVTTWLLAVRTGAYTMLDAFLTAGILIPSLLSHFAYGEHIKPVQWIGFVLLILAVIIMCSYNNSIKKKITFGALMLLIACSASSGVENFTQKILKYAYPEVLPSTYSFYSYLFAMLSLAVVFLIVKPKNEKPCSVKNFGIYLIIMAVCLFLNTYFKTLAAQGLDASIMYPICQGGALVLSSAMAAIMFKEPIKKRSVLGIIMIFTALMIITFA